MTGAVSGDTRAKLIRGAIETLRDKGIAGTSARVIASAAGVNQALVFYHFGSVTELVDAACREGAAERVAAYREEFDAVTSLRGLLELGRTLNVRERAAGNVTVLAQVLAGAQQDASLAAAAQQAVSLWVAVIEATLDRLLVDSPLAELASAAGLARGIAASFIGIELYEGVDPAGAESALAALETLGVLVEVMEDLGPVARRALRARVRRTTRRSVARKEPE